MCQGRPCRVMVQFSGPGPKHGLIAAPVMLPALAPLSPLPDLSVPVRLPLLQVIAAAVVATPQLLVVICS
jgi:hypothetical protein